MPLLDDETVEGRLAQLIENGDVLIDGYRVSGQDRAIIAKALRDRARWMTADIYSGEKGKRRAK